MESTARRPRAFGWRSNTLFRVAAYVGIVRVLTLGAVVSSIAVACASGATVQARSVGTTSKPAGAQEVEAALNAVATSKARVTHSAGVTQKAIGVSLPPSRYAIASFNRVDCPSVGRCVASFSERGKLLVLSQHGRKWTRDIAPADFFLVSLACPSVRSCVGTARDRGPAVYVVTQNGSSWRKSAIELPGSLDPSKSFPVLPAVSCGSAGSCTAVGWYATSKPGEITNHALLVDQASGTWGAGIDAQLPPDAATAPDVNGQGPGGEASVVSCASAGNCTAVGTYEVPVGDLNYPAGWAATEEAGQWRPSVSVRLPRGGKAAEHLAYTGLSCPSVGNCTAVGGSTDGKGGEQGLILKERDGSWLQAIPAPLPRGGVAPSEPNAFDDPLFSISCAAPNNCGAIGAYVNKGHHGYPGTYHGWLLSERHGRWSASKLVLPRNATTAGMVFLDQIDCPSPGNCVAIGSYNSHGRGHGLIVIERRGKWQRAIDAALPANAARPSRQLAGLDSVSCASTSRCTIVGSYNNNSKRRLGLILNLQIR